MQISSGTDDAKRFLFLDLSRGIALLLMLQGHFISATLDENSVSETDTFHYWKELRGYTAPLFFIVSGLVFNFLLLKTQALPLFENQRLRKGLKRVFLLFIAGYLLQFNFANISYYLNGNPGAHIFSFHVLQSIGAGLLLLIVLFVVFIKLLRVPWYIIYPLTLVCWLYLSGVVSTTEGYIPANAPELIQNSIKGPNSVFPVFPWSAYLLYGAFLGALFRQLHTRVRFALIPVVLLPILGIFLFLSGELLQYLQALTGLREIVYELYALKVMFQLTVFILFLLYLEKVLASTQTLLLIGKNTLTIYILHSLVLYGAITGTGIITFYRNTLTGWQAIVGALLFISFFAVLTVLQHKSEKPWLKLR